MRAFERIKQKWYAADGARLPHVGSCEAASRALKGASLIRLASLSPSLSLALPPSLSFPLYLSLSPSLPLSACLPWQQRRMRGQSPRGYSNCNTDRA